MRLSAASPGPQTVPKTKYKVIQLVSSPWHKESPKDGALMLTAQLFALCEDGTILRRGYKDGRWVWFVEEMEVING